MKKLFSRIISSLILFLVSGVVLADSPQITSGAVTNHTDLSISFLAQIFGTVGNVLHGTSGQMLGQLFYKLNQGILVVAGIWLAYTTLTIVLRAAHEGSFMGANKNVAIVFLKIALGIGLLIPNPATGYSIFQDVVMKVVIQGVALADQTWSYGLDYINNGGSLWYRPETGAQGMAWNDAKKLLTPAQQIFQNEVCMVKSSMINQSTTNQQNNSRNSIYNGDPSPVQYHYVVRGNKILFPGVGNTPDLSGNNNTEAPNCGLVDASTISDVSKANCATNNSSGQSTCEYARRATNQMVDNLLPAAKRYVCDQGSDSSQCIGISTQNVADDNTESFFGTLVNYTNSVMPIAQAVESSAAKNAKDFISTAESEGWMMAGRYYWDLSQIQTHYAQVSNLSSYQPTVNLPDDNWLKDHGLKQLVDNAGSDSQSYIANVQPKWNRYMNASGKGDVGNQAGDPNLHNPLGPIFTPIVTDLSHILAMFIQSQYWDPILLLHKIGMGCIGLAGTIWLGTALSIYGIMTATIFCQSTANTSTPVNQFLFWIKSMFTFLAVTFLTVGIVFGYYVPLYPFMLFIFGVIGWIVAVIEAMVAAPLVCFGLTHPEGHDFLDNIKQALMLLLGIFIRPVLMVIGLIAGMILSYVSLRILLYTYSGFLSDVFASSPNGGATSGGVLLNAGLALTHTLLESGTSTNAILQFLGLPLFLVIFAGLVYVVTNQCFSLIYALPDNVLLWIGAPTRPGMASQMADSIRGIVSGYGEQTGRGMQKAKSEHDRKSAQKKSSEVEHKLSDKSATLNSKGGGNKKPSGNANSANTANT